MCNQVKSEQNFPVTRAKRVAIFQASLKLEKMLEPNSLAGIINIWQSMDQTIYVKGVL